MVSVPLLWLGLRALLRIGVWACPCPLPAQHRNWVALASTPVSSIACRGFRFVRLDPPDCLSHFGIDRRAFGLHRQPDAPPAAHGRADDRHCSHYRRRHAHTRPDARPGRHRCRQCGCHHRRHSHAHPGTYRNAAANLYAVPDGDALPHAGTLADAYAVPYGDGIAYAYALSDSYRLPYGDALPDGNTLPNTTAGH